MSTLIFFKLFHPILIVTVALQICIKMIRENFLITYCVVILIHISLWSFVPVKNHIQNAYAFKGYDSVDDPEFSLKMEMFKPRHGPYLHTFGDVTSQPELTKRLEDLDYRIKNPFSLAGAAIRICFDGIVIIGLGLLFRALQNSESIFDRRKTRNNSWSKTKKD